ncbi:MAG: PilZ domain-containing protein [Candidatus Eremiobacteraeota bacterium]|nr:PilZ domain-containing protein [Candidatus Eremiobacteraeota bacterium]
MPSEQKDRESAEEVREHRDFPRLEVDAKVRIAGTATHDAPELPANLSDLSLGGARLVTPADLEEGSEVGLIPFSGLMEEHPLHRTLEFQVIWRGPQGDSKWREYGLAHTGSVLDVLHSWLGHLLLRQRADTQLLEQRRENRRLRFDKVEEQQLVARTSHDQSEYRLVLLDAAPGGILARSESAGPEVGMHLSLDLGLGPELLEEPITGCVIDKRDQFDSTFYRIAFDPDSQLGDELLVQWARRVGAELTDF